MSSKKQALVTLNVQKVFNSANLGDVSQAATTKNTSKMRG